VGLFRRRKPLHRELAEAAGLSFEARPAPSGLSAEPPGWSGEQRGEPGIHGVPRARRWDVVATTEAPALRGGTVQFVALPDGTLVVDEDEPEASLTPLADAVEQTIAPPYRAEAVRRGGAAWAVAARRIEVVEAPELVGDDVEYAVTRNGYTCRVDGRTTLQRSPSLERAAAAAGPEYVVRATRLDGALWEVGVTPL
jgi:hypothetical protein